MMFYVKTFFVSLVILCVLDVAWLGFIMRDFNTDQMKGIARMKDGSITALKGPAALTYLTMALALTVFAAPKIIEGTWASSMGFGALLGFCIYGVYDGTNYAVLKDYPLPFVFTDIGWGVISYGLANTALFFLRSYLV